MENSRFEIFLERENEYCFNLISSDGDIILSCQSLKDRAACLRGVFSVKFYSTNDTLYKRLQSSNNEFYFVLNNENAKAIGKSRLYKIEQDRIMRSR
jgi:uncharacterized protein YegP (UPF0339 family)